MKKKTLTTSTVEGRTVIGHVESPFSTVKLPRPATDDVRLVVEGGLSDADARQLADYASRYKAATVCISHRPSSEYSLQFLQHFPFLHGFDLFDYDFSDPAELDWLPKTLKTLTLGLTRGKSLDLQFLERLPKLQTLYVERHAKCIESVGRLRDLRDLRLRSITLPGLECLLPLKRLHSLDVKLGGTTNLDLVPKIGRIRYLELWLIHGLVALDWLPQVKSLQYLFLQALRNVTELPSFKPLQGLRRVHLEQMKGLHRFEPLAEAPNLEELELIEMRHLTPAALQAFVGHRSLRFASISLGSRKKDDAAEAVLTLPPVSGPFEFR